MSKLSSISASPVIRQFAQGAAQDATQPVADFVAPTVEVATSVGKYKQYTEKSRFRIPNTVRALGGRATELSFDAADQNYNCTPHALDFPVDNLEQLEGSSLENVMREGAVAVAEVAGLAHEKTVVDAALAAAGGGTGSVFSNSGVYPVDVVDTAILAVMKAAKYGSLMGVGMLWGASAFKIFKNAPNVKNLFVVGSGGKGAVSVGLAMPTPGTVQEMFLGSPENRISFMVYDNAAEGVAESIQWVLDASLLIFARKANPTRRDPSFMKTFRLMGQWMVPGSYMRDDGRVEVAKMDWSEDVVVTNSAAVVRLNIT